MNTLPDIHAMRRTMENTANRRAASKEQNEESKHLIAHT
jgi:hypothetical protein